MVLSLQVLKEVATNVTRNLEPCRYGYPIKCTSFSTDAAGQVTELAAEYDADFRTQQKKPPKVWVLLLAHLCAGC
jgi:hypothetical protein